MEEIMEDKTKDELIDIIEELKENIECLYDKIDDLDDFNGIKDVDNFLWILKRDEYELYKKIEPFINNYLKYYNN